MNILNPASLICMTAGMIWVIAAAVSLFRNPYATSKYMIRLIFGLILVGLAIPAASLVDNLKQDITQQVVGSANSYTVLNEDDIKDYNNLTTSNDKTNFYLIENLKVKEITNEYTLCEKESIQIKLVGIKKRTIKNWNTYNMLRPTSLDAYGSIQEINEPQSTLTVKIVYQNPGEKNNNSRILSICMILPLMILLLGLSAIRS